MLTLNHKQIPELLRQLPQPPASLHVTGADILDLLNRPRLAVVGSRRVTPYGRGVTQSLVTGLASKGIIIVSGLALGVDSLAHQACLDTGGQTIAVLPCGPDRIYPSSHTNLARAIIDKGGALVTEYPIGTEPFPSNFLERNRLIAALSDAVLVTEAAARSGSLNTANHALDLGKPVFAVPGNITSPMSKGCNNLIKAGAIPVTSVDDILNALGWQTEAKSPDKINANTDEERALIGLIASGISDGATLLNDSGLEAALFNQTMTMLEITGRIRPLGANNWAL